MRRDNDDESLSRSPGNRRRFPIWKRRECGNLESDQKE